MTIISTIGASNSNSYATVAEVSAYILDHSTAADVAALWAAASNDQKEAALIKATQLMDRHIKWAGDIGSSDQALAWPRAYAIDRFERCIANNVIPAFVKEFQIETTLWILQQSSEIPEVGNGEFDSIRVGTLEVNFNEKGAPRRLLLPETVTSALSPMGHYTAQTAGGAASVSVTRS
jgi:flagellar biosynthesis regulator FlaF